MPAGLFNTGNFTQSLVKPSFAQMITRLMPNGQAPLFGISSRLNQETALQVEHGYLAKTMLFPEVTTSSSATSTDTTINVTSTANIIPNMLLRVNGTNEMIIVNTVLSATALSVTRGVGNVSAATINSSTRLFQVGTAYEEASTRPQALYIAPVRITNLTQIFRNTWALSGTVEATEVIAGNTTVAENKQDCAMFHAVDIEKALIFGQKAQGVRNSQPWRMMDGVISIVSNTANYPSIYNGVANVTTFGSTTNFTQFETAVDPMFNQNTDPSTANERVLFVGGTARRALVNMCRLNSTYFVEGEKTDWGLQFTTIRTSRGVFQLIEHPLFNSNSVWSSMIIGLDLSTFRIAYLRGRQTRYEGFGVTGANNIDFGTDAIGGTLTTECTILMKNPPANFVGYNCLAGAAG